MAIKKRDATGPVGLAIIGCGRISRSHLPAVAELQARGDVRLIATADLDVVRARAAAETYGALRSYDSTEAVLVDPEVEGVLVTLPHDQHAPVAIQAARAGRHVLVEKPLCNTVAEADAMIAAADAASTVLMVGQSRRWFDAVQESRRRLPAIGRLVNVTFTWSVYLPGPATGWWTSAARAGGLLVALNGSHTVDYLLWLIGADPVRVYAETSRNNLQWEGEDEVTLVLRFPAQPGDPGAGAAGGAGPIATIHLSFNTRPGVHERLIVGTEGRMFLKGETELWLGNELLVSGEQRPGNFVRQAGEFVAAIREGRRPSAAAEDGRRVVRVLEAALRSAREHTAVSLA